MKIMVGQITTIAVPIISILLCNLDTRIRLDLKFDRLWRRLISLSFLCFECLETLVGESSVQTEEFETKKKKDKLYALARWEVLILSSFGVFQSSKNWNRVDSQTRDKALHCLEPHNSSWRVFYRRNIDCECTLNTSKERLSCLEKHDQSLWWMCQTNGSNEPDEWQ